MGHEVHCLLFLLFCFAGVHKTSIGFDIVGFGGNLTYKRWPSFPVYNKLTINRADPSDPDIGPDYIEDLSLISISEEGAKAEQSGKPLELTITAATGVSEVEVRKKIDSIIGDVAAYKQQVFDKLPNQNNTAFMGGIGLSGGYHYHLPMVICNVRAGVDYICGEFKSKDLYPASLTQMGLGIKTGIGIDYKLTDKATFGFEGGVRISAFRNPKIGQSSTETSCLVLPYMQAVCGFNPCNDYGISTFIGYFFPKRFSISASGGNLSSNTTCKIDGMFGGIKFARYF